MKERESENLLAVSTIYNFKSFRIYDDYRIVKDNNDNLYICANSDSYTTYELKDINAQNMLLDFINIGNELPDRYWEPYNTLFNGDIESAIDELFDNYSPDLCSIYENLPIVRFNNLELDMKLKIAKSILRFVKKYGLLYLYNKYKLDSYCRNNSNFIIMDLHSIFPYWIKSKENVRLEEYIGDRVCTIYQRDQLNGYDPNKFMDLHWFGETQIEPIIDTEKYYTYFNFSEAHTVEGTCEPVVLILSELERIYVYSKMWDKYLTKGEPGSADDEILHKLCVLSINIKKINLYIPSNFDNHNNLEITLNTAFDNLIEFLKYTFVQDMQYQKTRIRFCVRCNKPYVSKSPYSLHCSSSCSTYDRVMKHRNKEKIKQLLSESKTAEEISETLNIPIDDIIDMIGCLSEHSSN